MFPKKSINSHVAGNVPTSSTTSDASSSLNISTSDGRNPYLDQRCTTEVPRRG